MLEDTTSFTPLLIERASGKTQLFVKEVTVEGRRYIVARNEAEAGRARAAECAARCRPVVGSDSGPSSDRPPRSNSPVGPAAKRDAVDFGEAIGVIGGKRLKLHLFCMHLPHSESVVIVIQVEELFRTAKALMRTRPIYHSSDAAIRGHVFCSFLALILRKELQGRCEVAGLKPEWAELMRDLDRLQDTELTKDGKTMMLRTPVSGSVGFLFKAAGVALPPNMRDAA